MASDIDRRAHAIVTRAMELEGSDRDAWLAVARAEDPAVGERVERLMRSLVESEHFLERPALAGLSGSTRPQAMGPAPDAIGDYTVVGVLGVGGMATVYEALQRSPERRVAIKLLHQPIHMPTKSSERSQHAEALLRFKLEAQALARLHHVGIAQIYEAGTANLGSGSDDRSGKVSSPFIVMELIPDALPLTTYAERHELTLPARIDMFLAVCDAVMHAHQNGIIHRDLKPANVLVGSDGVPKVIDFGIARHVDGGGPLVTATEDQARLIGTLHAMSPEQCLDPASVDARSDVYSLGALLYELVTGRRPHDLSEVSIPEAVRRITESRPPSAELYVPAARGDLAAVIAKALEKDRTRRYSTVEALASDLRRYREHRPVEARRVTNWGELRLFAKRNPPLASAIAAAVLFLLVGAALSTGFALLATRARDAALARERDLEAVTSFQESLLAGLDPEALGQSLAQSIEDALRQRDVRETPTDVATSIELWNRLREPVDFTTVAVRGLYASLLAPYAASINTRFANQPEVRARLSQQLAGTMSQIGLHREALPIIRDAYHTRRDLRGESDLATIQSRFSLGSLLSLLGAHDEARLHLEATYTTARAVVGPDDALTLNIGTSLGGLYRRMALMADAERVWSDTLARQRRVLGDEDERTLRSLNNIGVLYASTGRLKEALAAWSELFELRVRTLGPDHDETSAVRANLGAILHTLGRYAEAEPLLREALAIDRRTLGDAHTSTLTAKAMLAALLRSMKQFDEAALLQRACYEGRVIALKEGHAATLRAKALLGAILVDQGRVAEATTLLREALDAQQTLLGPGHPETLDTRGFLRDAYRTDGALDEAIRAGEAILRDLETSSLAEVDRAPHFVHHARSLAKAGQLSEADKVLAEGRRLLLASVGEEHPDAREAAILGQEIDSRKR